MTNTADIKDITTLVRERVDLRDTLKKMVKEYPAEDIVGILAETLSDEGYAVAQRTGDYSRATDLLITARYLERLETYLDNYEPDTEEDL